MYTYYGIVNELLSEFPEISKNYAEEIAWIRDTFKSQETGGQTIYFDRCFCDYIGHLLVDECQDNIKIEKVFTFLEDMAVSEDQEVRNRRRMSYPVSVHDRMCEKHKSATRSI